MIGEQICIRRVWLFIVLVTLLCSWDVSCFQGKKTAKEVTTSYLVDLASLDIDDDTAQLLWDNCRAEMVRVKDTVEELELDVCISHQGPDSFNYKCKSEEKEKIRQFLSLLYPDLKQTLIDCLRKNGLPFRVSGEEVGSSNWFTFYIDRLSSTLAIHRRFLQSPPSVAEGPEASPTFRDVSEASAPLSPTSQDSINGPVPANSSEGDDKKKIVIAVVVTACVTFLFALVLFLCFFKVCTPGPQSGPNDDKPLLGQSTSYSSSGSPYDGFFYGGPFKEENLNSQSPDPKPKVSYLDGSEAIEAGVPKQSFDRPSVGSYAGGLKVELQAYKGSSMMPLKQPPGRVGSSLKPPLGRSPSVLNAPQGRYPSMKPPPARNPSVLKPPPARNPSVLKPPPARNPSVLKPPPVRADPLPHEPPAPPKPPSIVAAPPPPPPPGLRPSIGSGGPRPPGPPPPPPPGPGGRAPGPPPPPPPKGGGAGPRPPPQPFGRGGRPPPLAPMTPGGADDGDGPKSKLKPFFWDKVLANPGQSMVWHQIKGGSFQFNEEMIESLFGYNAVEKAKKETKKESSAQESSSTVVQIIDAKKSQNLAILLRALNVTIEEVRDALVEGNELPVEFLQTVLKMAPTSDEELKLRLYDGELSVLGPADRFLKVMISIPFAFKRMDTLLFMSSLQEELTFVKDSFSTLEVACQELRNSRLFLKLLEAVLKTGNRMNSGTFRGGAQAFKLDTLLKLSDVKGTDGKTTLLHFVVQEIIRSEGVRAVRVAKEKNSFFSIEETGVDEEEYYRNLGLQVVSGLGGELGNVKKAAIIDADTLTGAVARLGFSLMKAQDLLNTDLKNLEEESGFNRVLKSFVQNAETNIMGLMEEEKKIMAMVKRTGDYFHGNTAKDEGLKLFIVVRDFLVMLDKTCREVKDAPPMRLSKPKKKEGGPNLAPSGSDSSLASPAAIELRNRLFPAIQDRRQDESSSSDEDS